MAQRRRAGQAVRLVAAEGDGGPAEVERHALGIEHHLDHIGIAEIGQIVNDVGRRAHAGLRPVGQQLRDIAHQRRVDQRFIALHIDDDFILCQAQHMAGFGEAIAA